MMISREDFRWFKNELEDHDQAYCPQTFEHSECQYELEETDTEMLNGRITVDYKCPRCSARYKATFTLNSLSCTKGPVPFEF